MLFWNVILSLFEYMVSFLLYVYLSDCNVIFEMVKKKYVYEFICICIFLFFNDKKYWI